MNKYLISSFALVSAISFNILFKNEAKAIEDKQEPFNYYVFNSSAPVTYEKLISSYTRSNTRPGSMADGSCIGQGKVCWFLLTDMNGDGSVNNWDFSIKVNIMDTDNDGIISDNQHDNQLNQYEERN